MSATLYGFQGFDPISTEWARWPATRSAPGRTPTGRPQPVGYRGGPLPGLTGSKLVEPAAPGRWRESLTRWLAEMPRQMPPLG